MFVNEHQQILAGNHPSARLGCLIIHPFRRSFIFPGLELQTEVHPDKSSVWRRGVQISGVQGAHSFADASLQGL